MYVINIKISQEWKKKFNKVQLFTGKEPKFPTPSPPPPPPPLPTPDSSPPPKK